MPLDFYAATAPLLAPIKLEELAAALGCSLGSVKQARMKEGVGRRPPPPGWEAAVARLARQKAAQLLKLADKLS